MRLRVLPVALTGLVFSIGGCANDVNVRSEWGAGMSQYGLTPVYPLRENVYVGDVYLVVHSPCEHSNTKLMQMVLLGSLPVEQTAADFSNFYGRRPELPSTSAKKPAADGKPTKPAAPATPSKVTATVNAVGPGTATMTLSPNGAASASEPSPTSPPAAGPAPVPQAVADSSDPIYVPKGKPDRPFNRLRLASFPDFSLGSSYRLTAGAGGLIGGFNAALGLGGGETAHLNVSVSGVEEAVVPAPALMRSVQSFLRAPGADDVLDPVTIGKLQETLEDQMMQEPGCRNPVSKMPTINFVNRVFYARTVTFDFGRSDVFATVLKAAAPTGAATQGAAAASSSSSSGGGSSASTGTDSNQAAAEAMQKQISSLVGSGAPGGSLSLGIATSGSVALKQTFDRPMAFGVDHTIGYFWADLLDNLISRKGASADADSSSGHGKVANYRSLDRGMLRRISSEGILLAQATTPPPPSDPCGLDPKSVECWRKLSEEQRVKPPACGKATTCGNETTRVPNDSVLK